MDTLLNLFPELELVGLEMQLEILRLVNRAKMAELKERNAHHAAAARRPTMTAAQAISRSTQQQEIVHCDWSPELDQDLRCECDDNCDVPERAVIEFWGTTDGDQWRVHLTEVPHMMDACDGDRS